MISFPLGVLVLALQFITRARANSPQIFVTSTLLSFDARIVEGWSGGGGDRWKIANDSNHPFTGRRFGAADRWTLKGTPAFGSGYPYGKSDNSTIAGRDFPYGMWPIYWGNNTMGSDEYGPALDGIRPGGQLVTIPLKTTKEFYPDLTDGESYYIIADRDSAVLMMLSFVDSCHVLPAWPIKFDPTSPSSTLKIKNVISYYRASSFALASPHYTNAFPIGDNNTESTNSTPLPDFISSSKFHKCIDDVILDALPIMNWPSGGGGWTDGQMFGFIFGILGFPMLGIAICSLMIIKAILAGTLSWIKDIHKGRVNAKRQQEIALAKKAKALSERAEVLRYEQFP